MDSWLTPQLPRRPPSSPAPSRETVTADTCSDCGGPVRWVVSEQGRRIELNPIPAEDGNVVPTVVGGRIVARVLGGDELPAEGPAWRRHSQTCPESADAKARRARTSPKCRVCLGPMDPEVTRLEGTDTHPTCDPAEGAQIAREALRTSLAKGKSA